MSVDPETPDALGVPTVIVTLAQALPIAAVIVDHSGVVRCWNEAAETLFELPVVDAVGRSFRTLDASYRLTGVAHALSDVASTGAPARVDDAVLTRRDGTEKTVTLVLSPVAGGAGPAALILADESSAAEAASLRVEIALLGQKLEDSIDSADAAREERDITAEELRSTITELETRVEELEAARQAGYHKDQFLAMLAHELRAPLAPLLSAARILRRSVTDAPVLLRAVEIVERQVAQQARLLDDLLDVSRIVHGRIELRIAPCTLSQVIDEAIEMVRALADGRGHRIAVSMPPEPMVVDGDRARLVQVVGNLLNNAVKFTPSAGSIDVDLTREDDVAVLRVRDNGIGIPLDQLETVFELFEQADASVAHSAGGLGLGLPLVRSLVRLHGGTVEARSGGQGRGSEFIVRLPVSDVAGIRTTPAVSPPESSPCRILVVEDNPDTRESLRVSLELDGHHVDTAEDGTRALAIALESAPDVVFLDIGLPGLDGYEVARRLRAAFGHRVRIVALTAYGRSDDRAKGFAAGVDAYVVKPAGADELMRLVADLPREAPAQRPR